MAQTVTAPKFEIVTASGRGVHLAPPGQDQICMRPVLARTSREGGATYFSSALGLVIVGACIGCLVGHVLAAILTLLLAVRRFAMPLIVGHLARITLATLVMIAVLATVRWPETRLGLAAETMASGAVYLDNRASLDKAA